MARILTTLNFYAPATSCPTVESEYVRHVFQELKAARMSVRKNIQNALRIQYDKKARDTKISAGDLATYVC